MASSNPCHCVFPSPTEETLATFEGRAPGTAIRVLVEPGVDGYVRLQQMAYNDGMGWYVQKSMVISGELLRAITSELRKADCLIPKPSQPAAPLRLTPAGDEPSEPAAKLRLA